jgi:pimeloyl-ACP methyl ester carboxylesterase
MRVQEGGAGDPVLLLLHGLGATSDVWNGVQPLLAGRWPGRWLAPDLPGHGGSDRLDRYTFDTFAAALAELVDATARVVVIGHSMGGAVGINLASGGFGVDVAGVVGFGIKVSWAPEELERARALSQRPVTWFDTRDEAADRYLRISGLSGLVDPSDDAVGRGLRELSGRWRLALDPPAFGVGAPDMPRLLAQAKAPVLLARGEHDQLVSHGQLAALVADPVSLPGLGHNAHVEDPAAVIGLLDRIAL